MKKVLVLTSGGLDSTVLLYKAINEVGAQNVVMLNMYYGQKHDVEIAMARWHAKQHSVEYHELDISAVMQFDKTSALLKGSDKEIAHESYADQLKHTDVVSAYVPYRNGLLLSIATSIAYSLGCDTVAYGAHADDAVRRETGGAAYPDCTKEFIDAQRSAIREGSGGRVDLWAPLWNLTKVGVVKEGIDNGMTRNEFEHTHSCYEGKQGGCGTCGTCRDREAALDAWDITRGVGQTGVKRNITD